MSVTPYRKREKFLMAIMLATCAVRKIRRSHQQKEQKYHGWKALLIMLLKYVWGDPPSMWYKIMSININFKRKPSYMWQYFAPVNEQEAECNICRLKIRYNCGVTNLKRHFDRLHPTVNIVPPGKKAKKTMDFPDAPFYVRKRYFVFIWLFVGYIQMSLLSVNFNICIVDLTSSKIITVRNTSYVQKAEYDWTPFQKGLLLSAVSWGNLAAPLGALISNKFGGMRTFGISILLIGLLTILSPVLIQWNLYAFFSIRCAEGVLQGVSLASAFTCFVKWIPPGERARLVSFTLSGMIVGAAISYPVIGFISYYFIWKNVFYITGGMTICWYILFHLTIEESPLEDKFITKIEKTFLERAGCLKVTRQSKIVIPWKSIFSSIPIYAYWNDRFVEGWSHSFLYTCLPLYIKDIYPSNIKDIGILSGLPHLFSALSIVIISWLLDYLRSRENSSKTNLHKKFILTGQVPGACLLILIAYWENFYFAIIGFSIFKICFAAACSSYYLLPLDMSPEHTNILLSIGVTLKSIASTANPIVVGLMIQNHSSQEWYQYFFFLSVFNIWGAIVFIKYGSGEVQL